MRRREEIFNEFLEKYGEGRRILGTPRNRAQLPAELIGQPLTGQKVLEVPIQTEPVPTELAELFRRNGIIIRDPQGTTYN